MKTEPPPSRSRADAEELARLDELLELYRGLAANNEKTAAQMMGLARVICRDVIALCDAAPADRPIVARGARARAERVLEALGDDERAN